MDSSAQVEYVLRQAATKFFNPDGPREADMLINEMEGLDYVQGQRDAFDKVYEILQGLADWEALQ